MRGLPTCLIGCLCLGLALSASAQSRATLTGARMGNGPQAAFAVMAQSNAVGSAGTEAVPGTRDTVETGDGYMTPRLWLRLGSSWNVPLTDSLLHSDAWEATQWPYFANKWLEEVGEPVDIVMTALGGSCLIGDDGTGDEPQWDPTGATGTLYAGAIAAIKASGVGSSLRAVIWIGGGCEAEDDTNWDGTVATMEAAVEELADYVWNDLGVPMLVGELGILAGPGNCGARTQRWINVHDAINNAAADHAKILDTVIELDSITWDTDCHHLNQPDLVADAIFNALVAEGLAY